MATEDLRERIRRGDLEALADPALSLHLLADGPTAGWWHEGVVACAAKVQRRCSWQLSGEQLADVFDQWAAEARFSRRTGKGWDVQLRYISEQPSTTSRWEALQRLVGGLLEELHPPEQQAWALRFTRRLQAATADRSPEIEVALTLLEHYSPPGVALPP